MELIHGLHKDVVDIKEINERQGVPINLSNIEVGDYIKVMILKMVLSDTIRL